MGNYAEFRIEILFIALSVSVVNSIANISIIYKHEYVFLYNEARKFFVN